MLLVDPWPDPASSEVSFEVQDSLPQSVLSSPTPAVVLVRLGDYTTSIGNRIDAVGGKKIWSVGYSI